ncbi:MAG: DUF992 domain-containing protein [Hyphomicrobiaceae bacterium]
MSNNRMVHHWMMRLAFVAFCMFLGASLSQAQNARLVAGTLTCEGQGSVGLILGSQERLRCAYTPAGGGRTLRYDGTITRVGLDVGVRGKSVMIWTVLGSTSQLPGTALGGSFAGVSADVAAGIGAGANVLVGGNNNSVVLQPLSVKAATGVNLAIGVSGLNLRPTAG